jgi:hypothetical protein
MSRVPTASRRTGARHLVGLNGGGCGAAPSGGVVRAAQRPGDRHEAWLVEQLPEGALGRIRNEATAAQVSLELAVSLVLQRGLVESDLVAAVGAPTSVKMIDAIDRAADAAEVRRAVSPSYAAYVRSLAATPRPSARLLSVPVPIRVIERLGERPDTTYVTDVKVTGALAWERAAALAGQTLAEWAALRAATWLTSQR